MTFEAHLLTVVHQQAAKQIITFFRNRPQIDAVLWINARARATATVESVRARTGGLRPLQFEHQENTRTSVLPSTPLLLDAEVHWTWGNPLNLIPAAMLLVFVISIVETIFSLI